VRLGLVILLCVASARAEADATKAWKSECRWLAGQEKKFWRNYQERFNQGRILMNAEVDKAWAQPDQYKEATYDYTEFSKLYEDKKHPFAGMVGTDAVPHNGSIKEQPWYTC